MAVVFVMLFFVAVVWQKGTSWKREQSERERIAEFERDGRKKAEQERKRQLGVAKRHITNDFQHRIRNVNIRSIAFNENLIEITVDVEYARISDGLQRRAILKLHSNSIRVGILKDSYHVDVATGDPIGKPSDGWSGW